MIHFNSQYSVRVCCLLCFLNFFFFFFFFFFFLILYMYILAFEMLEHSFETKTTNIDSSRMWLELCNSQRTGTLFFSFYIGIWTSDLFLFLPFKIINNYKNKIAKAVSYHANFTTKSSFRDNNCHEYFSASAEKGDSSLGQEPKIMKFLRVVLLLIDY